MYPPMIPISQFIMQPKQSNEQVTFLPYYQPEYRNYYNNMYNNAAATGYPQTGPALKSIIDEKPEPIEDKGDDIDENKEESEDEDKDGILGDLKDLEEDVKGFSDAMKGMTEAMLIGKKDGSVDLTEEIKAVESKDGKKKVKKMMKKKKGPQLKFAKAFIKTMKNKRRLEDQMVEIFSNYICGNDC